MFVQSVLMSLLVLFGVNAAVWYHKYWLTLTLLLVGFLSCPFLAIAVCMQSIFAFFSMVFLFIPKSRPARINLQ